MSGKVIQKVRKVVVFVLNMLRNLWQKFFGPKDSPIFFAEDTEDENDVTLLPEEWCKI